MHIDERLRRSSRWRNAGFLLHQPFVTNGVLRVDANVGRQGVTVQFYGAACYARLGDELGGRLGRRRQSWGSNASGIRRQLLVRSVYQHIVFPEIPTRLRSRENVDDRRGVPDERLF